MQIVMPIPADAPEADFSHYKHGQPVRVHTYRNERNEAMFYVCRYEYQETGTIKKLFSPLTCWQRADGGFEWKRQAPPEPRPLYGLELLAERPDAPVLVVEGEKAAEAARGLFPAYVCITTMNGAQSPQKSNFSPLAGRNVTVWPDADSAGLKYASEVVKLAYAAGAASCRVVLLPDSLPKGWDLADPLPDGLTHEWRLQMLERATLVKPDEPKPELEVELICINDVKEKPLEWLWNERIPLGKPTVIAGNPGLGKSQITAFMAAKVTTGGAWPEKEGNAPLGDVIILSAEDDAADTIKPRLLAAGADVTKCHVLEAVIVNNNGKQSQRSFNLVDDAERLAAVLERIGTVKLVIIDPISAYLGKTDSHNNADLRGVLAPFSTLAAKYGVAIVFVTHFNKSNGQEAIARVIGSIGLVAAARAGYAIVKDDKDPDTRYFVPLKCNNGKDYNGFAYQIEGVKLNNHIKTSKIVWQEGLVDAHSVLSAVPEAKATASTAAAAEFLTEQLKGKPPMLKAQIDELANGAGISNSALGRTKQRLGIKHRKLGMDKGWEWYWPEPATPPRAWHEGTEDAEHCNL
jgi:putative DNA primase/helicase